MSDAIAAGPARIRRRFGPPLLLAVGIGCGLLPSAGRPGADLAVAGLCLLALAGLMGLFPLDRRAARVAAMLAACGGLLLGLAWALRAGELALAPSLLSVWWLPWLALLFAGAIVPILFAMAFPARLPGLPLAFLIGQLGGALWLWEPRHLLEDAVLRSLMEWVAAAHVVALLVAWLARRWLVALERGLSTRRSLEADLAQTRAELVETREARESVSNELAVTRNQAEVADVAKTEFLATISHEIRTPLNGILPILEMLRETELTKEQRQHVDTALSSSRHLLRIINDILDYSKIEAGKLELESINLNLREVVRAVTTLLSKSAERKGLRITTIVHDDVPMFVSGDPIRLRQILINLVGNAIKFTEHGGVSVEVINQRSGRRIVDLLFIVRDTGIGMSAKTAAKLFQSFSQADASTTRKHGGSGLGLAICKRLVELMGGTIGVRSQQGVGSLFWFQVPFRRTLEVNEDRADLSNARVLVLSGDEARQKWLDDLLGRWGVMKAMAATMEEAVSKIASSARLGFSWSYEAVIIDAAGRYEAIPGFVERLHRLTEMDDVKVLILGDRARVDLPEESESYVEIISEKCSENEVRLALNHLLGIGEATPKQTWWHDDQPEGALLADDDRSETVVGLLPDGDDHREVAREPEPVFHGRVLVAEDNPVNLAVVVRLLSRLGLDVDQALNGAEAVKMISARSYDLVFMDCQMPGVDGYEATRIVREREDEIGIMQRVVIVAMTANAMPGDRERCLQCGMDDYLSKPIDRIGLRHLLAKWLKSDEDSHSGGAETVSSGEGEEDAPPASEPRAVASHEVMPDPVETDEHPLETEPGVIDREVLSELQEIMGEEFTRLLQRYLDIAPAQLKNIDEGLMRGALAEVAKVAHSLKSSCANVGAMRMSELARRIELAAKENEQLSCLELNQQLAREAWRVETALSRLLADCLERE